MSTKNQKDYLKPEKEGICTPFRRRKIKNKVTSDKGKRGPLVAVWHGVRGGPGGKKGIKKKNVRRKSDIITGVTTQKVDQNSPKRERGEGELETKGSGLGGLGGREEGG